MAVVISSSSFFFSSSFSTSSYSSSSSSFSSFSSFSSSHPPSNYPLPPPPHSSPTHLFTGNNQLPWSTSTTLDSCGRLHCSCELFQKLVISFSSFSVGFCSNEGKVIWYQLELRKQLADASTECSSCQESESEEMGITLLFIATHY